jgi:flagella basal body P-ring formation protein FlgA
MRIRSILLLCALSFMVWAQEASPDLTAALQQQALVYAEAQAAGLSGSLLIRVLRPPTLPRLPAGTVRFEPSHVSKQDFAGPFFVTFRIFVNQRPAGTVRVDLEGRWTGSLLRTRTTLARKAVPSEDQLEVIPFEGIPPPGALTEFPTGYQLKIPLAAGHILCHSDIQAIPLINIGDPVRLEMVCGSLVVTSDTVARTAGGLGDKVRLELPNSRRCLQALVTGPGEARINWMRAGS